MNKPTLTKEQANTLEYERKKQGEDTFLRCHAEGCYITLRDLTLDQVARALYIGYTVVMTLNAYGHVVEGVNDK